MFKRNKLILLFSLFCLISCINRQTPEFYFTENGLKYQYHDIVIDGKHPKENDFLNVYMEFKTIDDSVFYSSKNTQVQGIESIKLGSATKKGGIEEGFFKLMTGDSVSFYINPDEFFHHYLSIKTPEFLLNENEIKITLRLLSILSNKEQNIFKDLLVKNSKNGELKLIDQVRKEWLNLYDTIINIGEITIVPFFRSNNEKIIVGETVLIDYEAKFTNNYVFYSTFSSSPDEFIVGGEGQTTAGFKNVLLTLAKGDHVMALVPSSLAFKDKGSSNGLVPPYTPIIFDVTVISKKVKR